MRGRARRTSAASVVVLGLLALSTPLAHADPTAEPYAATCAPQIRVLPTVDGPEPGESAVYGLSLKGDLAVGQSQGLPAYWVDGAVHRVPLPAGYASGAVLAVNRFGLMVGRVNVGDHWSPSRAFRYWPGNKTVSLYPTIASATDVNDAGQAVGYADTSDKIYVFGPGTHLRRVLSMPDRYTRVREGIQLNNTGYVLASGVFEETPSGSAVDSFTWTPTSGEPRPTLPTHVLGAASSESNDTIWEWVQPLALDNRNRMVGGRWGVYKPDGAYSWSSLTATATSPSFPPTGELGGLAGTLVALGDRSGIAAGNATVSVGLKGWTPPWYDPETAVVWDGTGPILPLPDGEYADAFAAQDDGRVGGKRSGSPVVWTCALGR